MPTRQPVLVAIPKDIKVPKGKSLQVDDTPLSKKLEPGWAQLEAGELAAVERSARAILVKEPRYLYAYSQVLDALSGRLRAGDGDADSIRGELRAFAWTLLALARRGIEDLHEDYNHLYRQKAATLLAELALATPPLVSIADGTRLCNEALSLPVKRSDQMHMTGTWNTRSVMTKLANRT